jgi:hypothetical protein
VSPWTRKVIESELERLRNPPEGNCNDTLRRVSFKLGQLAGGGLADAASLKIELYRIAICWPEQAKSLSTIERAFAAGQSKPRAHPPSHTSQAIFVLRRLQNG